MDRQPAVAGYFYPADPDELRKSIADLLVDTEKKPATAVVVPHAGYMYSGHVAGAVYSSVELPQRYIILCPNHTGYGSDFDLWTEGYWITPVGKAKVDTDLCNQLMHRFPHAVRDGRAHLREHSLEVQIPFLQYLKGEIQFLPLCIRRQEYRYLEELGHVLAELIRESAEKILLVASSDMSHYEPAEQARKKDFLAIEKMEKVDARGLYDTVNKYDISMCGYLPATVTMIACQDLGVKKGELVKYANSGDITKDYSEVVGYAGLRF